MIHLRPFVIIGIFLFSVAPIIRGASPGVVLKNYLLEPSEEGKVQALEVLEQAQVVRLEYVHPDLVEPGTPTSEYVKSLSMPRYTGTSMHQANGKRKRGLHAVFSVFQSERGNRESSTAWLDEMKVPFQHGYTLESVSIVLAPPLDVREKTHQLAEAFIENLAKKLEEGKSEYPQLRTFDENSIQNFSWQAREDWSAFSFITFNQDIEDHRPLTTSSEDWCSLYVSLHWVGSRMHPSPSSGLRSFPRQGCYLTWSIRTATSSPIASDNHDDPFQSFVQNSILDSLDKLTAFEASLPDISIEPAEK